MAIGTWTTEKMKSLKVRALEIAKDLGIPENEAWTLMSACETQRVLETVERMEKEQARRDRAELRSLAARAATFKANIVEGDDK
jgi:hypothetical protein